jgi:hypothetical protein
MMRNIDEKRWDSIIIVYVKILFILISYSFSLKASEHILESPDDNIAVYFGISGEKNAYYRVTYCDTVILQNSKLGIIREDHDFSSNLTLLFATPPEIVQANYEMLQGKRRHCSYLAYKRTFQLKNSSDQRMDILFQVSNDGVAYRYIFPGRSDEVKKIKKEISSFHFLPGTKAYIQPMAEAKSGWSQVNPSYEEHYQQGIDVNRLPYNKAGWVFPALLQFAEYWLLISETAPDRNYCGCRLQNDSASCEFFIGFPDARESFKGGPVNPQSKLPWSTPWRIIAIGKGLKAVVESTLGTDLAESCKLKDVSYVKPGQSSWSWVLLKDDSTVYHVQKRFIDLAADMRWEYCLVDAAWDVKIGYDKMAELAAYAAKKKVDLLAWYNSSGDWNTTPYTPKSKLLTHEDRMKEFSKLKEMGIKGVKVDFFGGDGQSVMGYYQDIFEDAAKCNLLVNCHGATIPRGWQRTYPNLLTMEAVRGFEFVTFDQYNADLQPNHSCMLPFTRNVFDPMDFTPVCFSEVPNIKRVTTKGFELALSVIFTSGIQHFAETPKGMAKVPAEVKKFLREIPAYWDDTHFIAGFPGKFVILARRYNSSWYLAGINGEQSEKDLDLKVPFFSKETKGIVIKDGADERTFDIKKIQVKPDNPLKIQMKGYGGFVIKLDDTF